MNDKTTWGNIQIFVILLAPAGTIKGRNKLAVSLSSASFECESQSCLLIVKLFENPSALFLCVAYLAPR